MRNRVSELQQQEQVSEIGNRQSRLSATNHCNRDNALYSLMVAVVIMAYLQVLGK